MKITHSLRYRFNLLLAASLTLGGAIYLAAPVLADGTAAGTSIRNTATGTFSDGTTTYNATSNEVVIEVSEIAGIDLTAQALSNDSPNAGDTLYVDFIITNTGNDPTQFFIPGTATLSNTTAFAPNGPIQIIATNGTPLTTPVNVPAAGGATGTLLTPATGSFAANPGTGNVGTVTIRVPIRALPSATAGQSTTVALGNTTPANGQNIGITAGAPGDVYTVDNPNGQGGEINATAPTNGVREAMATSATVTVGARLQAFARILKAVSSYSNNSTPNDLLDDTLNYALALRVDNPTTPPSGVVATDLHGTAISVNGSTGTPYVLVSDAVPAGLQLATANPTAPAGWTAVYSQTPLTTNALAAAWSTTRPTAGGPITRVGFVFSTATAPLSRGTVGVGNMISGFTMAMTPTAAFTGGQVSNIAQVFGQSQPGAVAPGTSTQIVYDESGDQTSNNGLAANNPDPATGGPTGATGGITDGIANPAADGTDSGTGNNPTDTTGTNIGTDAAGNGTKTLGGEVTPFTIAATPLNGPSGQPGAVGPNNNNDDFTSKSIVLPTGLNPATPLTDAQTPPTVFTNTVQNTSGGVQVISLLPTAPTTATALPDGTTVLITNPATGMSATYNYTATDGFVFVSGTGGTSKDNPVDLTVPGGGNVNYTVTVNLPDGVAQLTEFPIPIVAFVDTANDGSPTGDPSNTTIDYLYTSYLSLIKEARVLEADGTTTVAGPAGTFGTNQAALTAAALPGRVIEYRITYRNLARTAGSGINNVTLPANNLVITENGSAGTNNWAASTIDPDYPAQANGSADDPNGSIAVTVGGTPTDIQTYTDTVATVAPGTTGSFTFQRKIK
jgi:hypothetical protein